MLRNPRNLLWILPLVLFVISPLWIPGVRSFLQPRGGFDVEASMPKFGEQKQQFVMDDITITMSSAGRIEWVINAEQAHTIRSDKEIGMVEVDALYTADNKEKTHITSVRGQYKVDEGHLTLIENVVILKPEAQQEMYTELLHYYNENKKVVCPESVELRGPEFSIQAGRLDYDLDREAYDFSDRVNVTIASQNAL